MEAMNMEKHPIPGKRYTYEDYYNWEDGIRYELIDGQAYLMEPAPGYGHQDISVQLTRIFSNYLEGKPGKVFHAPFDVRLNFDTGDNTVLQPDIVVFLDRSKLAGTGSLGAPDMVIEILSPSTSRRDRVTKYNQYLQAGVKEYWIVDPKAKTVSANILDDGRYLCTDYAKPDVAPVRILEGCMIKLAEVFEDWD